MAGMKHVRQLIVLSLMLLLTPVLHAQDAAPNDIEDVKTPTDLGKLLPEGGIKAVDIDFWLAMEMPEGPAGGAGGMFMHWSIRPEADKLVVQMSQGGDGGFYRTQRIVYSDKGKLESFSNHMRFGGFGGQEITGKVEGDDLVVVRKNLTPEEPLGDVPDDPEPPQTRRVAMKDVQSTVPPEWMPLIFAYHARLGSLGYEIPMNELAGEKDSAGTLAVEDQGTEVVAFDGKDHKAHVLSVTMVQGQTQREQTMQMLVLEDGAIMKMVMSADEMKMAASRVTAAQAKEKFNLDENGEPKPQPAAPGEEKLQENPTVQDAPAPAEG